LWRNATLATAFARFRAVFGTVAYYGSDEHEWAFLFGRADTGRIDSGRVDSGRADDVEFPQSSRDDVTSSPIADMVQRLPGLAYRPRTIDAAALSRCSVPPHSVRVPSRSWTCN
jgi:spermidine synthase